MKSLLMQKEFLKLSGRKQRQTLVIFVDDWLDSRTAYTTEQLADLSERLTGVIKTWLEETHNEPDFFNIIGEKEISICNIPQ